jgi:hypothetical protein
MAEGNINVTLDQADNSVKDFERITDERGLSAVMPGKLRPGQAPKPRLLQKDKGEYPQKNDTADNCIGDGVSDASFVRRLDDFGHVQTRSMKRCGLPCPTAA